MSDIEITRDSPVTIIRINRPHVRNAINKAMALALRRAWLDFEADDTARVGVITGDESVFCAGADLNDLNALAEDIEGEFGPLGFTRLSISKPTIAAISGYCVAGGLEIACWCDLRIADETAVFGCFERRFGVPLVDGGTQRLSLIVGLGRALDVILTGRPINAAEALAMGLVTEVVPAGQSLRRAIELGHTLAAFPQVCLRNDRQAVYGGLARDLSEGLQLEARLGTETTRSGEMQARVSLFQAGKGRSGMFE
jgi:enoyl-CoA hydratase